VNASWMACHPMPRWTEQRLPWPLTLPDRLFVPGGKQRNLSDSHRLIRRPLCSAQYRTHAGFVLLKLRPHADVAHRIGPPAREMYVIQFYELADQRPAIKMSRIPTQNFEWAVAERPEKFCSLPSLAVHQLSHRHERAETQ
jgi:hypothetical protein